MTKTPEPAARPHGARFRSAALVDPHGLSCSPLTWHNAALRATEQLNYNCARTGVPVFGYRLLARGCERGAPLWPALMAAEALSWPMPADDRVAQMLAICSRLSRGNLRDQVSQHFYGTGPVVARVRHARSGHSWREQPSACRRGHSVRLFTARPRPGLLRYLYSGIVPRRTGVAVISWLSRPLTVTTGLPTA